MSIHLTKYGEYLKVQGHDFVVDKGGWNPRYPFHKVKRVVLSSGNSVSTTALFWLATYGIETVIVSKTGKLVSTIVPAKDDARADIRLKQYGACTSEKGFLIARSLVEAKVNSKISLMKRYEMNPIQLEEWLYEIPDPDVMDYNTRNRLQAYEAKCTRYFWKQYFNRFPEWLKPKKRDKYKAKDALNNLLNLGYEVLKRSIHVAIIQAKLDPYLGFLHSTQTYKPALVYDMMEPIRALVEEFLLQYHPMLSESNFIEVGERRYLNKQTQWEYTLALTKALDNRVPYIRRGTQGKRKISTIIQEEPVKLSQYIQGKSTIFNPYNYEGTEFNRQNRWIEEIRLNSR